MKENLKFEAYLSLDVPNPLCREIYAIRDAFSDKKMSVMPVDIPLIGHCDTDMTLIREREQACSCVDKAVESQAYEGTKSFKLKTGDYSINAQGQLVLHLINTESIMRLRECILKQFLLSPSSLLRALADRELNREFEPVIYTVLKSHMPKAAFEEILMTVPDEAFETTFLSFYHKEAVPLTRIQSWAI